MADLCGIIARRRHEKLFEEMAAAVPLGLSLLEVRLDFLPREPRLAEIRKRRTMPLIATIRRKEDGGHWTGPEEKRLTLLRLAVAEGFDYVDLEADAALAVPRYGKTKRIVSHHNFDSVPHNLEALHADLCALDADLVKIAVKAQRASDVFRVLRLLQASPKPTIAFCMGDWGVPSRILGAKFGSPFTYAALNPFRVVAPGLQTVAALRDLYHYERIDAATEVYGVLGDPIAHSLSPLVHNTCFRKLGLNKVYLPFRVSKADVKDFMQESEIVRPRGLSVTIPHKQGVLAFGTPADDLVRQSNSANTMVRRDGTWHLYNTDGAAAVDSLVAALPPDPETGFRSLEDRQVLLLGAGGVARSVAFCLRNNGAMLTIVARRYEEAKSLASEVGCRALQWEERYVHLFEIIVNCTPLGMHPDLNSTPFQSSALKETMTVLDTVYNPENTLLIREAKVRACKTLTGVEMFVRQAEAQFRLFADGRDPPPGLMAELVREELSPARTMLREARQTKSANSQA